MAVTLAGVGSGLRAAGDVRVPRQPRGVAAAPSSMTQDPQ